MNEFICLICGKTIETLVDDEGHVENCKCGECHSMYDFDKRNRIIDGKLCGLGCQIRYDYVARGLAPVPTRK